MGDVVPLRPETAVENETETETWADGEAVCMSCHSKWHAVAPVPVTTFLECPVCHAMKGTYVNYFEPAGGSVWECNCGNQLFFITETGWHCPNCGGNFKA